MSTLPALPGGMPPQTMSPPGAPLRIAVWAAPVAGGWRPWDLDAGLPQPMEHLVLWAQALAARGHEVRVYHNQPGGPFRESCRGVQYRPHQDFVAQDTHPVLVSWGSNLPWRLGARAALALHWSEQPEAPWPQALHQRIDKVLVPHAAQLAAWTALPPAQQGVVPWGIDTTLAALTRQDKRPGRLLVAAPLSGAAPDAGLSWLLQHWPAWRQHQGQDQPPLTLEVFLPWRYLQTGYGQTMGWRRLGPLLAQEGVIWRGGQERREVWAAFWRAQYWLAPVDLPPNDMGRTREGLLARWCQAQPVRLNPELLDGNALLPRSSTATLTESALLGLLAQPGEATSLCLDWQTVVERYWEPILRGS